MLIKCISGATRHLGAPPDWNGKDMSCGVLPVIDVPTPEGNFMVSAWEPTPSELRAMQAGHSVYLGIRGSTHPVVFVHVPEAAHFEQDAQPATICSAALEEAADKQLSAAYRAGMGGDEFNILTAKRAITSALQSSPAPKQDEPTSAARDVLIERQRQKEVEGWTPSHDDEHNDGELAVVAGYYALACGWPHECDIGHGHLPKHWPLAWDKSWWKPGGKRRNLVKAAALILAEIERLDRSSLPSASGDEQSPARWIVFGDEEGGT